MPCPRVGIREVKKQYKRQGHEEKNRATTPNVARISTRTRNHQRHKETTCKTRHTDHTIPTHSQKLKRQQYSTTAPERIHCTSSIFDTGTKKLHNYPWHPHAATHAALQ